MKIDINNVKRQDFWSLSDNYKETIAYMNSGVANSPICTLYESIYDKQGKSIKPCELSRWISRGKFKDQIERIRNANSLEERRELKMKLPAIMLGGLSKNRKDVENISGLMIIDFDHINDIEFYQKQIKTYPFVYMAFKSPTDGLKVIVIAEIKTKEEYNTFINELFNVFESDLGLAGDSSKQNINDLCFLSYDPELYINEFAHNYNEYRNKFKKTELNPDSILQNIEYLCKQIEERQVDITDDYRNWLKIGLALNSFFNEEGRQYFHRISQVSKKYKEQECDKQYDYIVKSNKSGIRIGTLFFIAKSFGLKFLEVSPQIKLDKEYFTGKELLDLNMEELPCLIDPIFPESGLVAIGGSSDTGKSSFLRQLAIDIVTGSDYFLGFKINAKHRKAIYVSTEDDMQSTSYLLRKQRKEYRFDSLEIENLIYIFETDKLKEKIEKIIEKELVDIVIIDTYSDLFSGDFNSLNVRGYLNDFRSIALKYKCLFVFLHHTSKKSVGKDPSKNNLLGSQSFEAKMRLVIELIKDNTENSLRHMCIVKGNYIKDEEKRSSYLLEFNENMVFKNTGKRVPFSSINNSNEKNKEDKRDLKKEALKLKNEGLSYIQIGEKLNISKSTIGRLLKDDEELVN